MKTIRWSMVMSGLFLALFALAVTGVKAQVLSTNFKGTFTLPLETHWGAVTLPAGDYSLEYGTLHGGGYLVTVGGEAAGSSRRMILPAGRGDVSAKKNVINCVRENNTLFVSALELPAIGESAHFMIPHLVKVRSRVIAGHQNQNGNNQLAQVSIGIERVPVK